MGLSADQLLERLAERAGDGETAGVARTNRSDEEAMARKLAQRWDRVLDVMLAPEIAASGGGAA